MTDDNKENLVNAKFAAITRGSILASVESKLVNYVAIADRRAQGLLGIVAILIPVVLSRIETSYCREGVVVFVVFGFLTVVFCVMAMAPKHYRREKGSASANSIFHFSEMGMMDEHTYINRLRETLEDDSALAESMSRELFHMGKDVLKPKFKWLRLAYASFLIGLAVSVLLTITSFFASL